MAAKTPRHNDKISLTVLLGVLVSLWQKLFCYKKHTKTITTKLKNREDKQCQMLMI